MSRFAAERDLATLAAEDGELQEADDGLSALIQRIDDELQQRADDARLIYELCRCLIDRAKVRAWAVKPVQALQDLDRAAPLIEGLKPVNRQQLRISRLDTLARLLSAPHLPVYDAAAARRAVADLRREVADLRDAWMADAVELHLARNEQDWARVAELVASVSPVLQHRGLVRGVNALHALGARAWLNLGQPQRALDPARRAHEFFDAEGPPDIAAQATLALARASGGAAAWPLAEQALSTVERLTRAQRSVFDQQRFLVEKTQLFDDALQLALALADSAAGGDERERALLRAWQVAERAKSFSLRQAMTQGGWLRALDAESAAQLEALDQQLEAAEAQAEYSAAVLDRQAELATQRQRLLHTAMQRSPALQQTQAPPPLDLHQHLRTLPEGVGVVSWYWLRERPGWRLHVFHAGADRVARHASVAWHDADVNALEQARLAPGRTNLLHLRPALPAALSRQALPPAVLQALSGCHTLLLTPHRHLRQLPLHTMQLPREAGQQQDDELLIDRFAVEVLPTLALPFPSPHAAPERRRVLLMGSAQDGFFNPRLDDVPPELRELSAIWSAAGQQVDLHDMASDARLAAHMPLARWPDFDLIHLACHGRFVAGSPLDATLYLGGEALRASEFFALRLRADVVSLSACDVGQQGDAIEGMALTSDEWLGLALPLFQSGARHLLCSLWAAESAGARSFMRDFHAALARGQTPAHAHRQACLAQRRRPYGFWANWQLAGFPA
jgi:CHAT domain-containing protein